MIGHCHRCPATTFVVLRDLEWCREHFLTSESVPITDEEIAHHFPRTRSGRVDAGTLGSHQPPP